MSAASLQYNQFKTECVQEGKVYTFTKGGEYLVHPVQEREAIPFWSSRMRMEKTQQSSQKYKGYKISEMSLTDFIEWLPELGTENIQIGANWTGSPLAGYDVSVPDLLAGLKHLLSRQSKRPTSPAAN